MRSVNTNFCGGSSEMTFANFLQGLLVHLRPFCGGRGRRASRVNWTLPDTREKRVWSRAIPTFIIWGIALSD